MNFIFCKLKKTQKTWISFFANLKNLKKHEFRFFASLKNLKKHCLDITNPVIGKLPLHPLPPVVMSRALGFDPGVEPNQYHIPPAVFELSSGSRCTSNPLSVTVYTVNVAGSVVVGCSGSGAGIVISCDPQQKKFSRESLKNLKKHEFHFLQA